MSLCKLLNSKPAAKIKQNYITTVATHQGCKQEVFLLYYKSYKANS